ncbi:MAG TPA: hypothetical protein VN253_21490 [Kofleriaceae bacterium]|nr:hypothetical protein [Kofleriaceae bacterium]
MRRPIFTADAMTGARPAQMADLEDVSARETASGFRFVIGSSASAETFVWKITTMKADEICSGQM